MTVPIQCPLTLRIVYILSSPTITTTTGLTAVDHEVLDALELAGNAHEDTHTNLCEANKPA